MITTILFVKVLETTAPKGDRAIRLDKAWRVSICNGDEEFYPISSFSCFDTGDYFDKDKAVAWAKRTAGILDGVPVMLYRAIPNSEPQFVEDIV